ncbi:carboxylesterase family protein [Actinomadura coerulea]|uniref:carboxylesterase family protein n=1 Tax=Actinomadura coerulea TaxID=46159 RepID=UPI00341F7D12
MVWIPGGGYVMGDYGLPEYDGGRLAASGTVVVSLSYRLGAEGFRIRGAWTAFAAHGDPGWPAYDARGRLAQLFDAPSTITAYPEEASRLLWRDHAFPALPLLAGQRA